MAHRSSAAAIHTARKIVREYELTVKPNGPIAILDASPEKLSVVIDYATNVFKIASLRPELRYWQKHLKIGAASAGQIATFIQKLLNELALVPQDAPTAKPVTATYHISEFQKFEVPNFKDGIVVQHLTKAAREVTRCVFFYYFVKPHNGVADEKMDQHNMTRLAEACLGISRVMPIIPYLKETLKRLKEGKVTEIEIRKCMREVGVKMTYLPNYGSQDINEETKLLV